MTDELACLRDISTTIPFEALNALVSALLTRPELLDQVCERYKDIYVDNPYERDEFEVVYLPYVLIEAARRGTLEQRRRIIEELVGEMECRADDEDWSAREFLFNCVKTLPFNDLAPCVLEPLARCLRRDDGMEAMIYWDLLAPTWNEGSEEIRQRVRDLAMEALQAAHDEKKISPDAPFFCYRLAELKHLPALPLMRAVEQHLRRVSKSAIDRIDANGVRDAIEILEGKRDPYEERPAKPLLQVVQEEVDMYAEWYRKRKEPGYQAEGDADEFEALEEPEESPPIMPNYGEQTLAALGFDDRHRLGGSGRKIGRNDPCPCGSGKKYKKCCGG